MAGQCCRQRAIASGKSRCEGYIVSLQKHLFCYLLASTSPAQGHSESCSTGMFPPGDTQVVMRAAGFTQAHGTLPHVPY